MRACEICGKKSLIQKSGAHQYGGAWAMRATKKRTVWMSNLHSVKVTYRGVRRTMRLCSKCLRRVKATVPKPVIASTSSSLSVNSAKQSESVIVVPKVKDEAPVAA